MIDLRVGRIVRAERHEKARKPSYKLWIDFGDSQGLGIRQSSAQLTHLYQLDDLIGKLVVEGINLGERNIAGFLSQVLVLGVPDDAGRVILLTTERPIPLGGRVF